MAILAGNFPSPSVVQYKGLANKALAKINGFAPLRFKKPVVRTTCRSCDLKE